MLILFASLAVLYIGGLVIYRIFFHPLRKYPGPFLAALTEGYEAYFNIVKGGDFVNEIERLHKLYGPVIRVGPNTLHFKDRQAFHDIYTYGSTLTKEHGLYHALMSHVRESSIGFTDPQEAKNRRSLIGPLFSRRAILALEYVVQTKINKLVTLIEENCRSTSSAVDLKVAFHSLTMDIITSYCFAESSNMLDVTDLSNPRLGAIHGALERLWLQRLWLQRHIPFIAEFALKAPESLVRLLVPKFAGYKDMSMRIGMEKMVDKLIQDPDSLSAAEHETIFHHLLVVPKSLERPSRRSLVDEAITLVGAGSGTVATACTIGTFYFLKDQRVRQKILQELLEAWPDKDAPMSYASLEKLPYLTAFIKETLRFSPGIIHPLTRTTTRTTTIGGLEIPPGTSVEMSMIFMLMNPDIYRDPHTFNPDRWLAEDTTEMMLDLVPFMKGPRICLGMNLAWCEMYLIFANMFRKLNLSLLVTEDIIDDFSKDIIDCFVPIWEKGYQAFVDSKPQG